MNTTTWIKRDCGEHFGPPRSNGENHCAKCAYNSKLSMRYPLPHYNMRNFVSCVERKKVQS